MRTRACNNPTPAFGGASCAGRSSSMRECNTHPCDIDCEVGKWGTWSKCSKPCYDGVEYGQRLRIRPVTVQQSENGKECPALIE